MDYKQKYEELFSLSTQMADKLDECRKFIEGGHPTLPEESLELVNKFDDFCESNP